MSKPRYIVGIDLGTTTCSVFYIDTLIKDDSPQNFPITQWQDMARTVSSAKLPAFCYLPQKKDYNKGQLDLDCYGEKAQNINYALGEFAQKQQILYSDRVIHSAKSWLSCETVERTANILPWASEVIPVEQRFSPSRVLSYYLSHIKFCWDSDFASLDISYSLALQDIVITVPASYDLVATELTLSAASQAGLTNVRLIEEPQAAFYSWLYDNQHLNKKGSLLVCDLGGGTCDFSLFDIVESGADIKAKRIEVGEHILLGGDNIDLALANFLDKEKKLTPRQWARLLTSVRELKEKVLINIPKEENTYKISIANDGANLFSTKKIFNITSTDILRIVVEGFFPDCKEDILPERKLDAISDLGLDYAKDSRVTRHLAKFVAKRHIDYIMFAGGSLYPELIQEKIKSLVEKWKDKTIEKLSVKDIGLSVGRGASVYGLSLRKTSLKVESASPFSLFIKIRHGQKNKLVCLFKKGSLETNYIIPGLNFLLDLGKLVSFEVLSTKEDCDYNVGDIIDCKLDENFKRLPLLQTKLQAKGKQQQASISLKIEKTSIGVLNILCLDIQSEKRWKLNFQLGSVKEKSKLQKTIYKNYLNSEQLEKIKLVLKSTFIKSTSNNKPADSIKLIENIIGSKKTEWEIKVIRQILDIALEFIHKRTKDMSSESFFYNFIGYLGRPGFGDSQDLSRVEKIWSIYQQGIFHKDSKQVETQWWVMWRRLSGGLDKDQQNKVFQKLFPRIRKEQASSEVILLLGSLEKIDSTKKISLGNTLSKQLNSSLAVQKIWAMTRISSRTLLYSSADNLILPVFVKPWIKIMLDFSSNKRYYQCISKFFIYSLRKLEDRNFDFDDSVRAEVLEKLRALQTPSKDLLALEEYKAYENSQCSQLFGEELPAGLTLL
jgi:molecular chaperone DnaK (HSP70)